MDLGRTQSLTVLLAVLLLATAGPVLAVSRRTEPLPDKPVIQPQGTDKEPTLVKAAPDSDTEEKSVPPGAEEEQSSSEGGEGSSIVSPPSDPTKAQDFFDKSDAKITETKPSVKLPPASAVVKNALANAMPGIGGESEGQGNTATSPDPNFGRITKLVMRALDIAQANKDVPSKPEFENPNPCKRKNADALLKEMVGCPKPKHPEESSAAAAEAESSESTESSAGGTKGEQSGGDAADNLITEEANAKEDSARGAEAVKNGMKALRKLRDAMKKAAEAMGA